VKSGHAAWNKGWTIAHIVLTTVVKNLQKSTAWMHSARRALMISARVFKQLLKNAHLLRCARHSSLRRTKKYASFLMTLRALPQAPSSAVALLRRMDIFEKPVAGSFLKSG
jgi:hypothetical protein